MPTRRRGRSLQCRWCALVGLPLPKSSRRPTDRRSAACGDLPSRPWTPESPATLPRSTTAPREQVCCNASSGCEPDCQQRPTPNRTTPRQATLRSSRSRAGTALHAASRLSLSKGSAKQPGPSSGQPQPQTTRLARACNGAQRIDGRSKALHNRTHLLPNGSAPAAGDDLAQRLRTPRAPQAYHAPQCEQRSKSAATACWLASNLGLGVGCWLSLDVLDAHLVDLAGECERRLIVVVERNG